jgi:hypothetical protein
MFSKMRTSKICYGCYIGNSEVTKSAYHYNHMTSVITQQQLFTHQWNVTLSRMFCLKNLIY